MGKFLSYLFAHLLADSITGWLNRRGAQTTTPPPPQVGIASPNQPSDLGGGGVATPFPPPDIEFLDGLPSGPPPANLLDDIELSDT